MPRSQEVKRWFDENRERLEIHPLSIGSGLESLLKIAPKDETLRRYCQATSTKQKEFLYINPEELNTVEKES